MSEQQATENDAPAKVITLCGSTRYKQHFEMVNRRLTMGGAVVISLGVFGHTDLPDYDWTTDASDLKRTLDRLHFQKIDMADEVYVVNPGGYIGESTSREVRYALANGKPVRFLTDDQPEESPCRTCGRDNGNGTHAALERVGHLSHPWEPTSAHDAFAESTRATPPESSAR
jgi:hypothetical protein